MKNYAIGQAALDADLSPIEKEFVKLEMVVNQLSALSADVQKRIEPILTPEGPERGECREVHSLPLAGQVKNQLEAHRIALEDIESRLLAMLSRVEL